MDNFNTYEYGAEQKSEGKYRTARILLLISYVLYAVIYFVVIYVTRIFPLGALIPLTLWIIVYFTWRYTSPDYKYIIEKGVFTFTVSYGKKSKARKKCEFKVSSAVSIAPRDTLLEKIKTNKPAHTYSAVPSAKSSDVYSAIFRNDAGELCVMHFVATAEALKLLHFLNSKTVITKTEY